MECLTLLYLGQFVPEFIEVGENLGVDFRAPDIVDIPQDSQNSPPKDKSRIRMPASQGPSSDDADIISEALTTVCRTSQRFG